MNKLKLNSIILIVIFCISYPSIYGQDWNSNGNNLFNTGILGTTSNWDILFQTDGITRMKLMETGNSTINGFNIDRSGFLGLSQDPSFFTGGAATPFSLLHLNGDNPLGAPQQDGYRDWMRYGITFNPHQSHQYGI